MIQAILHRTTLYATHTLISALLILVSMKPVVAENHFGIQSVIVLSGLPENRVIRRSEGITDDWKKGKVPQSSNLTGRRLKASDCTNEDGDLLHLNIFTYFSPSSKKNFVYMAIDDFGEEGGPELDKKIEQLREHVIFYPRKTGLAKERYIVKEDKDRASLVFDKEYVGNPILIEGAPDKWVIREVRQAQNGDLLYNAEEITIYPRNYYGDDTKKRGTTEVITVKRCRFQNSNKQHGAKTPSQGSSPSQGGGFGNQPTEPDPRPNLTRKDSAPNHPYGEIIITLKDELSARVVSEMLQEIDDRASVSYVYFPPGPGSSFMVVKTPFITTSEDFESFKNRLKSEGAFQYIVRVIPQVRIQTPKLRP